MKEKVALLYRIQYIRYVYNTYDNNEPTMLTHLIVRKSAILINRVDLSNFTTNRFTLEYSFLLTFGEQRYFVVNILQNDIDGRFGSELLGTIVLRKRINFILRVPSIFHLIPLLFFQF